MNTRMSTNSYQEGFVRGVEIANEHCDTSETKQEVVPGLAAYEWVEVQDMAGPYRTVGELQANIDTAPLTIQDPRDPHHDYYQWMLGLVAGRRLGAIRPALRLVANG